MPLPPERELIEVLTKGIDSIRNQRGLTDDCAVIGMGMTDVVLSLDTFSAPTHFPEGTPYRAMGRFATSAALSDLAAAGAEPLGVLVGYGLPASLAVEDAAAIAEGVRSSVGAFGGEVLGGDTKPRSVIELAVTALGTAPPGRAMSRAEARAGDHLIVTGSLGGAGGALARIAEGLAPAEASPLIDPIPRLREGNALLRTGVACCMDLSDGLADGASAIAAGSGVSTVVEAARVPLHPWAESTGDGLDLALHAGGDYELLTAVGPELLREALRALEQAGASPAVVGRVESGRGAFLEDGTGKAALGRGHQHAFGGNP